MNRIDEIKEALDAIDWPEHEFRGYCYTLLANLEIAESALRCVVSVSDGIARKYAQDALEQIKE